jgi:hypothetical protein
MASLAGYFKQQELSDIDLVLCCNPEQAADNDGSSPARKRTKLNSSNDSASVQEALQLAMLPGHKLILFTSDYFKAQVSCPAHADQICPA